MATYLELSTIVDGGNTRRDEFHTRIGMALRSSAEGILSDAAATTEESQWAVSVLSNVESEARYVAGLVVFRGNNENATIDQLLDADDVSLQSNVAAVVDGLIKGRAV